MEDFIISKVWDLSKKQTSSETLKILTESHLLIQVAKVIINCEGKCIEGWGKAIKTGSFVGRFQDKNVCFLKPDGNLIRDYEVALGQYCVISENEDFLLEYPLKAMMVYDFLLEKRYKNVLHVSDSEVFTRILDKMCLDLNVKMTNTKSEVACEIVRVLKFDVLLLGSRIENLSTALDGNEEIATYEKNLVNDYEEIDKKELCLMTWILGLSTFKRSHYYNYIKSNKILFNFDYETINSMNLIRDNLKSQKIKVLIIQHLFTSIPTTEKNRKSIEFKLPLHVVNRRRCTFSYNPNESCSSIDSTFRSFLSSEDQIDINSFESPRLVFPYSNLQEMITNDAPVKTSKVQIHESTLSIESTDLSFTKTNDRSDKSIEDFPYIDYLTGLISKYRNDNVLYVLSSIHHIYTYESCSQTIEGTYLKLLPDLSVYEGQMDENKQPHGFGSRYYVDGSVYRGFWKSGKASGQGLIVTSDGFIYNGQWKNGLYHGYGSLITKDKDFCEGDFRYGELEGIGIEVLNNGDKYHGNFYNSMRHGSGKLIFKSGVIFLGQFYEGKIVDKGKVFFNEKVFEGEFDGNVGKGVMEYLDGSKFYGNLIDFRETGSGFFESRGKMHRCFASDMEIEYFRDELSNYSGDEELIERIYE